MRVAEHPGRCGERVDIGLVDVDQVQRHELVAAIRGQQAAGVAGGQGSLALGRRDRRPEPSKTPVTFRDHGSFFILVAWYS
ncbi:hypothetical protein AB0J28_13645 [Streptosporangium canum]|uniref:hypothetical protein n=1 Tax=Streptosporangium canum TaxID=324952 RepID=UPI003416E9B7